VAQAFSVARDCQVSHATSATIEVTACTATTTRMGPIIGPNAQAPPLVVVAWSSVQAPSPVANTIDAAPPAARASACTATAHRVTVPAVPGGRKR
jgi:hypothetical protein